MNTSQTSSTPPVDDEWETEENQVSTPKNIVHNSPPKIIIGRWKALIDGLDYSADIFYQTLERKFNQREIPELVMGRVSFSQRGVLSQKRIYLRLIRNEFIFDICACPMGKGAFFVSYWHGFLRFQGTYGLFMRLGLMTPVLGHFLEKHLIPNSYHYTDSIDMFQQLAHNIIMETVDELTSEAHLPPLTYDEKKPVRKNLLNI